MVNLGDIAKATGYSKATVSRILSGDPSFTAKDSTRQRVIRAANQLGYALRSSRSAVPQTIAVLDNIDPSRGLQDSYFSEVREALHARAADNMMSLSFFPDVNSLVEAASNFSGFVSVGPAPLKQRDLDGLHAVLPHGVFIDINPAPTLFHSVRPDLQQTVIDAIYALREQGRQRIAFVGGDGHMMGGHLFAQDPRTFAFEQWARLLEMPVESAVYATGPFTVENGRHQAERLLDARARRRRPAGGRCPPGARRSRASRSRTDRGCLYRQSRGLRVHGTAAQLLRDRALRASRDRPHAAVGLDRGPFHAQAPRSPVDAAGGQAELRSCGGEAGELIGHATAGRESHIKAMRDAPDARGGAAGNRTLDPAADAVLTAATV